MNNIVDQVFAGFLKVLEAIIGFLFGGNIRIYITGFVLLNALGFYLMHHDKQLALKNGKIKEENKDLDEKQLNRKLYRRIPERTLILTALVGGSLGVLGGMYKFRHKTQKNLFKIGVPVIIGLQIVFIIWRIIVMLTKTPTV